MSADAVTSACVPQMLMQDLLRALPSEVQLNADCVAQPEISKRSAGPEPRAVTALYAYQTEKAHVHGTLVSYLHSGWQSESLSKASVEESDRGASGSALRVGESVGGRFSIDSELNPAGESGSVCWEQSRILTEQQWQERSTPLGQTS